MIENDVDIARCAAELRSTTVEVAGTGCIRPSQELSRKDRYKMLSQKFDIIAELGARNSVSYDMVMARFESIQQTLLQGERDAHFNTPHQKADWCTL